MDTYGADFDQVGDFPRLIQSKVGRRPDQLGVE